jgi:hypothetical protein
MSDSGKFLAVCKKEWVAVSLDNDELPISNLGAIRMGLEALQTEDAKDYTRAEQLWKKSNNLLSQESEDDEGSGATGVIQVNDDFCVAEIGGLCGYGRI